MVFRIRREFGIYTAREIDKRAFFRASNTRDHV
jgi:hypothetical protein